MSLGTSMAVETHQSVVQGLLILKIRGRLLPIIIIIIIILELSASFALSSASGV